jgi:hypothetical protein
VSHPCEVGANRSAWAGAGAAISDTTSAPVIAKTIAIALTTPILLWGDVGNYISLNTVVRNRLQSTPTQPSRLAVGRHSKDPPSTSPQTKRIGPWYRAGRDQPTHDRTDIDEHPEQLATRSLETFLTLEAFCLERGQNGPWYRTGSRSTDAADISDAITVPAP